jgi:hypothetical protein
MVLVLVTLTHPAIKHFTLAIHKNHLLLPFTLVSLH